MQYGQVIRGRFLARPNRFIAHVALPGGETVVCHVKNTGRCRELLTPDAAVYLERAANPDRPTISSPWKRAISLSTWMPRRPTAYLPSGRISLTLRPGW